MGAIFTYTMTYGGSLVALWRPYYGLLIYICFGIIKPPQLWFWSVPPGNYSRTIAIALIIGWAINGFGHLRFGKAKWPVFFMIGFTLMFTLSAVNSKSPDIAWESLEKILKIVFPVFIGLTLITNRKQISQVLWVIVLSITFIGYQKNLEYLQTGVTMQADGSANQLAHAMATATVMAFYLALCTKRLPARAVAFLCSAICLHTVFIYMSRGAMLGLVAAGIASFFVMRKSFRSILAVAAASIVVVVLAGPSVQEEFLSVTDTKTDGGRLELWQDMLEASLNSPLLGVGHNQWNSQAHRYGWNKGKSGHSLWVQMTCENGWIGGPCYLLFYLSIFVISWKAARQKTEDKTATCIAMCFVACVACHVVESFFGTFDRSELPYYMAFAGMASLMIYKFERSTKPAEIYWYVPVHHPQQPSTLV